jgi:valyl-tRNA synthetase
VVRAHYEYGSLPWASATLNGWILDPDRKKMSKSKGNVVTPTALFEKYGTDAVRYWAISARPGVDTIASEEQIKVGRRLATKLLNVSRFVLGIEGGADEITDPVDRAMVARLDAVVAEATSAFEGYDYARVLERVEAFFWWFCDDYVELVKGRAYGSRGEEAAMSARAALRQALGTLQRLLAPTLPFAAEEVWSWWHDGSSIHVQPWPEPTGSAGAGAGGVDLDAVSEILGRVRRAKTEVKVSQRAPVSRLVVRTPSGGAIEPARGDLVDALTVAELEVVDADELDVDVTVAAQA